MSFGQPVWGIVQRRIMLYLISHEPASLEEIASHIQHRDKYVTKRSIDALRPEYVLGDDRAIAMTATGREIAINVQAAIKDKPLCHATP
jgi:hypothetical protein